MSSSHVTPDQILDAIRLVPAARWGEVLHVIESLQGAKQNGTVAPQAVRTGQDLKNSDLIGIWADRPDLTDSREFAQQLRHQAEQRGR